MISETVVMIRRAPKPRAMDDRENITSKEWLIQSLFRVNQD